MQEQALKDFIVTLKNRRQGLESSLDTLENHPVNEGEHSQILLKAIPQAHINELDFVIPALEDVLAG
jgi:hypothetical protein